MQTLMAQKLAAVGFAPIEIDEIEPQPTMGRYDQHETLDSLIDKIEVRETPYVAVQPIIRLTTGKPIVKVDQQFKVVDLIADPHNERKYIRAIIKVDGHQHNVAYGAVFRSQREPREGDPTYESVFSKKEEPKASQALSAGIVFELHGILLATTGNSISFKKSSKATILNVIDSKSVAVKITEPFAKSRIFAVKTVSLLTSGKLVKSAKKAVAA